MSNRLNYVAYEYGELITQLTNLLKGNESWLDVYESSTGQTLIEFYAYVANLLLYYTERTAEEMYLDTAQRRSSVINLVSLLNYQPTRKVSAVGNVTFTLEAALTKNIFIPAKTILLTNDGYKFAVSVDAVIFAGQTFVTASVIQGEWITDTFTATGELAYEHIIDETSVEDTNINVYVDNVLWTKVDSFITSTAISTNYKIKTNLDSTISLVFGDDIFGKSLSLGSNVVIEYLKSDGAEGNVYSNGSITTIDSTIYDSDSTEVTTISVTNSSSILGGDNEESIAEIKYNAPRLFATGQRGVTKTDMQAILIDYPGIASANVWGENEVAPPNYDMFNVVKISMILQDWQLASNDFKTALSTYLYTKALMTVRYSYEDPTIIQVYPVVGVKVYNGFSLSSTESLVETELQNQFLLGSTSLIGTDTRHAVVLAALQSIAGVSWSYLTLNIYKALTNNYSSGYDYGTTLEMTNVKRSSVKIYQGTTQIAVDNGVGGFSSISSGIVVTGNISYTSGLLNINITGGTGSVYCLYEQDESGDLVVDKNYILKYYDSTITTAYA